MPQLLTAAGSATGFAPSPSIISERVESLTATGSAHASGTAAVLRKLPSGGVTDFGLWIAGQPDTAMSRDLTHSSGTDTSASRGWLTATAPTTYGPAGAPLWNKAVYAGIGIKWTGLANGERHSFGSIQLEPFSNGNRLSWDATSWEGRRCYTGQASVTYSTVTTSSDKALSGTQSGKITYTGAPAGTSGYTINPTRPLGMTAVIPYEVIEASVSLNMQRAAWWTGAVKFYDAAFNPLPTQFGVYQQHPGGGAWDTCNVYTVNVPFNAAWAAVVPVISINSTPTATDSIAPAGEVAYCDLHRIWNHPTLVKGNPTPYTTPRKLTINIRANRVNLVNNPGFDADIWGWGAVGYGTVPSPVTWDSTTGHTKLGALKYTIPPSPGLYALGIITGATLLTDWSVTEVGGFGWKPSTTYTSSVYVKPGPGCPNLTLTPGPYTPIAGVTDTSDAMENHPELIDGDWIRLWATFTTDSSDDGLVALQLQMNSSDIPASGATFWADDAVSESGSQLLSYFDGGTAGADYLWAGTAGRSSSHYYRGFRSNSYRLNDIVRSALPHGTQFTLLYAQPPE